MMTRASLLAVLLVCAVIVGRPAASQSISHDQAIHQAINSVILPDHKRFLDAAKAQATAWVGFCKSPSQTSSQEIVQGFEAAVLAFSRIELYRFGPARADNLLQRLFYWPDRKGRGLRQVQQLIADSDPSAASVDGLLGKSVAVQGLPALEFILYGTGSEDLLETGHYRCLYGTAVAGAIARNATELSTRWLGADGYASILKSSGPSNRIYRSEGEVFQELLRAAREQLQIVEQIKLGAVLSSEVDKAKPKRASFWRSNLTLATMAENLRAVEALMDATVGPLLSEREQWQMDSFRFQITEMLKVTDTVSATGLPWLSVIKDPGLYGKLAYGRIPVQGAGELVAEEFASSLGLTLGFNSLDGD